MSVCVPHVHTSTLRPLTAMINAEAQTFDGISTEKQEAAHLRRSLPLLRVREVELGGGHRVVSLSVIDATIRLLQEDRLVRDAMVAKSDEWKRGTAWKQPESECLDDIDKGSVMRNHPHLMRPAVDGEERDLRVAVMLYADEVETVDTGYAKSKHKLLTIQATYANLPIKLRFDHSVIQLLGIARHPAVMRWKQAGVFAGVQRVTLRVQRLVTLHGTLCVTLRVQRRVTLHVHDGNT